LGPHTELRKTVTNPSSFISSAGQYLALIPPYSSPSVKPADVSEASRWESSQNGGLSSFIIDRSFMAKLNAESDLGPIESQRIRKNRMRSCLLEARKLIAERKAACCDWRFSYDFGDPSPSIVSSAHMNENLLIPLPQEGLQNADECAAIVDLYRKFSENPDRNQWELDGLTQMTAEDDSILADLERFSAILREPTVSTPYYSRKATAPNSKNTSGVESRRDRQSEKKGTSDLEDIKRTSSLYDITFVDIDPDDITESVDLPPHIQINRMAQSGPIRRVSISSADSTTSQRSVELSLTESSEQLPLGVEEITKKGGVSDLMLYLDRIPGGDYGDGKAVESRFEACMRQFDKESQEKKVIDDGGDLKGRDALKGIDSGFASVDSALIKTSSTVLESSSIEAASFNPDKLIFDLCKVQISPFWGDSLNQTPNCFLLMGVMGRWYKCMIWLKITICSDDGLQLCSFPLLSLAGPLLTAILKLVNDIPSNHLYTNLQVTRLVTHLMALPLPIMRLQLLPLSLQETRGLGAHQLLYTTLTAVRQRFDCYVNLYFPAALNPSTDSAVAFVNLVGSLREIVFSQRMKQMRFYAHRPSRTLPILLYILVVESPKRLSWLLSRLRLNSLTNALTPSPSQFSSSPFKDDGKVNCDHEWRTLAMNRLGGIGSSSGSNLVPLKSVKDEKSRDILMALFVFEEFCRELSALCLEHSVAL
uniref:DUF5917 domain-containing protein n=1 Tax=Hymenolepis diminuta TaxID=6216 RepID=A0A158QCZ2_HYMDI